MSLVNNLLTEIDRRNEGTRNAKSSPVEGLAAQKTSRGRAFQPRPTAIALGLATISILGLLPFTKPATSPPTATIPPAVGAPRPAALTQQASILNQSEAQNDLVHHRLIPIRSISISQDGNTTRVRITTDEAAAYQIEQNEGNLQFEVRIESAELAYSLANLKLIGTPIRSLSTHEEDSGFRLSVDLDSEVRIQSQWAEYEYGSVLVIDLQGSSARPITTQAPRIRTNLLGPQALTTRSHHAKSSPPDSQMDPSPSEPRIAPSAKEKKRRNQDIARDLARRDVLAARRARSLGRLGEADALYQAAEATFPLYRDAILERSILLVELERTQDALHLISEARRTSPKDFSFTMLHGRIIAESGNIIEAVRVLDQANHSLQEAPNVHALAAALLQEAGDHANAATRYEALLRQYPRESRWWMGLGISLEALDRSREAVDVYRVAVQVGELPIKARQWVASRVVALAEEG